MFFTGKHKLYDEKVKFSVLQTGLGVFCTKNYLDSVLSSRIMQQNVKICKRLLQKNLWMGPFLTLESYIHPPGLMSVAV